MTITRMACCLCLLIVTFGLGMFVVTTVTKLSSYAEPGSEATPNAAEINAESSNETDTLFLQPVTVELRSCLEKGGELHQFGWNYSLSTTQVPRIKSMDQKGHWFYFETESENGISFEFIAKVPDKLAIRGEKIVMPGRLLRVSDGITTNDTEATYVVPRCYLK